MDYESKIVIPCINPGLCCCEHRLVATGHPADNVCRVQIWCGKWRENRSRPSLERGTGRERWMILALCVGFITGFICYKIIHWIRKI